MGTLVREQPDGFDKSLVVRMSTLVLTSVGRRGRDRGQSRLLPQSVSGDPKVVSKLVPIPLFPGLLRRPSSVPGGTVLSRWKGGGRGVVLRRGVQ